jgi:hypothetical protein
MYVTLLRFFEQHTKKFNNKSRDLSAANESPIRIQYLDSAFVQAAIFNNQTILYATHALFWLHYSSCGTRD